MDFGFCAAVCVAGADCVHGVVAGAVWNGRCCVGGLSASALPLLAC